MTEILALEKELNFWQGEKVRLRAIEPSDWEHFVRWNLDSERARHFSFVWPPTSAASQKAWITEQSIKKLENDAYRWIIENKAGEAAGTINTQECNHTNGTFSYGIDVAPEHRRKGYASEAIELVLKYYFEELRYQKVNVQVHDDNSASIGLHQKLGFTQEGLHRRMNFSHGEYHDELWFGMTIEEFRAGLS